jgi:hypothetical protein
MLAEKALRYIQLPYEIEREARELESDLRRQIRQEKPSRHGETAHLDDLQRYLEPEYAAIRRTLDYSLKTLGSAASMTGPSLLIIIGQRAKSGHGLWAATIMSLIKSARLSEIDPE